MAVKLGRVNVDAMLRSITAKQFFEWKAYAELEPFDERRADWRAASVVSMVYNMGVARAQDRKPMEEFVLKFDKPPKPEKTPEQLERMARLIALAYSVNAKDS